MAKVEVGQRWRKGDDVYEVEYVVNGRATQDGGPNAYTHATQALANGPLVVFDGADEVLRLKRGATYRCGTTPLRLVDWNYPTRADVRFADARFDVLGPGSLPRGVVSNRTYSYGQNAGERVHLTIRIGPSNVRAMAKHLIEVTDEQPNPVKVRVGQPTERDETDAELYARVLSTKYGYVDHVAYDPQVHLGGAHLDAVAEGLGVTRRRAATTEPPAPQQPAPRCGQVWRLHSLPSAGHLTVTSVGATFEIFDDGPYMHTPDGFALRLSDGLKAYGVSAETVLAHATYQSGPTAPETPREAFERVVRLEAADVPEGVSSERWLGMLVNACGEPRRRFTYAEYPFERPDYVRRVAAELRQQVAAGWREWVGDASKRGVR